MKFKVDDKIRKIGPHVLTNLKILNDNNGGYLIVRSCRKPCHYQFVGDETILAEIGQYDWCLIEETWELVKYNFKKPKEFKITYEI